MRRHDDRCRRNKIAKSPAGLPGRFKIPLTKGISSYWYQHRRFGYISLVTFGSRWTPSTRRAGGGGGVPGGQADRTDANYWQSDIGLGPITLGSPSVPFVSFYIPRGAGCPPYLSVPDSVLPRFHVKLLYEYAGRVRYAFYGKICRALREFKSPVFGQRKCPGSSRIPSPRCVLGASNCLGAAERSKFDRIVARGWISFFSPIFFSSCKFMQA